MQSIFSCADDLARDVEEMYINPANAIERGPNYFRAKTWKGNHTKEYGSRELGAAFSALAKMETTSLEMQPLCKSNRYNAVDVDGETLYGVLESISALAEE